MEKLPENVLLVLLMTQEEDEAGIEVMGSAGLTGAGWAAAASVLLDTGEGQLKRKGADVPVAVSYARKILSEYAQMDRRMRKVIQIDPKPDDNQGDTPALGPNGRDS